MCYFCNNQTIYSMSEERFAALGKIEAIEKLYKGTPFQPFRVSRFNPSDKGSVLTVSRIFLEGIDFNLVYFPLKHLGYKSVTVATGDLYAKMGHPKVLSIVVGVSAKLDFEPVKTLWEGMVAAATEHGYQQVSLDLVPSRNGLTISVSATGETLHETYSNRPKAHSKDLLCVSGPLGAAYLGMQVLERERQRFEKEGGAQPDLEKYKMMVGAYLKPELSPATVGLLEESGILPSWGYLVDHGLADAVKRLVRDSGLGAKVYADKIPFEGNSFLFGKEMDIDPVSAAMNGGEDFRLLFTIPILKLEQFRHDFQTFDIIGHLAQPEVGAVLVTPDGVEFPMKAQGWKNPTDTE